jgi:hypothetical protein
LGSRNGQEILGDLQLPWKLAWFFFTASTQRPRVGQLQASGHNQLQKASLHSTEKSNTHTINSGVEIIKEQ